MKSLRVVAYFEWELSPREKRDLEQKVSDAGGRLLTLFSQTPSINKIFEYSPDIIITNTEGPVSITWSFLLRLRSFRLQGKQWPKIILTNPDPMVGRYIHELDSYSEDYPDYYYIDPPYNDLYDVSLGRRPGDDLEICLVTIGIEYLAHTAGVQKQWLLTDGQIDYGRLTFKHILPVPLRCPIIVCTLQNYPPFDGLRERLEKEGNPEELGVQLKPIGETTRVDHFLFANLFDLGMVEEDIAIQLRSP